jgi:hypothetical protein
LWLHQLETLLEMQLPQAMQWQQVKQYLLVMRLLLGQVMQ